MSLNKYVILRSRNPIVPTLDNLGMRVGVRRFANEPETLSVDEVELSLAERNDLRRDPRVRAMAPPMPLKLVEPVETNDVSDAQVDEGTWGINAVGAPASPFDGSDITVAVLDTGIDSGHPAFNGVDIVQRNFTTESEQDRHGHGTHCAGTIFGQNVNGKRIGVAPNVKRALIGKVLGEGGGSSATIAQAIQWAVNEGAHVISMSLGIDFPGYVDHVVTRLNVDINPATSMALEAYRANINLFTELAEFVRAQSLFGQGTVIVAASGNESKRPDYEIAVAPPAAGTGIVAVGALQQGANGLTVARFSNDQVDIAAPGVNVVSAVPGGALQAMSGTSMATPHVAGVAALWAQRLRVQTGGVDPLQLQSRLLASGIREALAADTEADNVGAGLVQAPLN